MLTKSYILVTTQHPYGHEYSSYCCTTARMALNLEFPFFIAVSVMECNLAKSSAPLSVRKQPLTFCFILIFLTPRSLALSKSCDNASYPNFSFIPTFQLKTLSYA